MIFSDSPLDRVDIVQKMVCRYCLVLVGAWSGPCTRHEVPLSRCYRSLLTKISQNLEIKNRSSPLGVTFLTIACMMPHYCVSHRSASAHSHLHPESQMIWHLGMKVREVFTITCQKPSSAFTHIEESIRHYVKQALSQGKDYNRCVASRIQLLTNLPIPSDLCISVPISCLLTPYTEKALVGVLGNWDCENFTNVRFQLQ